MADIILKDFSENERTYSGVQKVKLNTSGGGTQIFSLGDTAESVPVTLDFKGGDQTLVAPEGKLIKSAIIEKPASLIPQNIVKGIVIAGIEGTSEGGDIVDEVDELLDAINGEQVKVTVTFKGANGKTLCTIDVEYGDNCPNPIDSGLISEPSKEATETTSYAFIGWSTEQNSEIADITSLQEITGHKTLYAAFIPCTIMGDCGDSVSWAISSDKEFLHIFGEGEMYDIGINKEPPYSEYVTNIKIVKVDYGVTSIGALAFSSISGTGGPIRFAIKKVILPDSITRIGNKAFSWCIFLESVTIPDSVTSIGSSAFFNTSLSSVEIPDSVTSIGEGAFSSLKYVNYITISEDNANYKSIDGNLYTKDGKTLIQYAIGKTDTQFTVPDSVIYIASEAFAGYSKLSSVIIGKNVQYIKTRAFDSSEIVSIDLSNGILKAIGSYAFYNCYDLASIIIPDSVTSIGEWAFRNCSRLTSVVIGNGITKIENSTFASNLGLTSVVIGDSVTSIGGSAFRRCSSLTSIEIPKNVTNIGENAFEACANLDYVTFRKTAGWTAGSTSISSTTLDNGYYAADLLVNQYSNRNWTRS